MPRLTRALFPLVVLLAAMLLLPLPAGAQERGLEIDIIGGNASALPIAVVPMPYEGSGSAPATDVADVVRADLARSGQFRTLPVADMVQRPTRGGDVDYPAWRLLGQDYLVIGRVLDAGARAGMSGCIYAIAGQYVIGDAGRKVVSASGQRTLPSRHYGLCCFRMIASAAA